MKESGDGSMDVAILAGGITDLDQAEAATLVKEVGTDQADADTYTKVDLRFNTGDNYYYCYFDDQCWCRIQSR